MTYNALITNVLLPNALMEDKALTAQQVPSLILSRSQILQPVHILLEAGLQRSELREGSLQSTSFRCPEAKRKTSP